MKARLALAAAAGLVGTLAFPPFGWWPLAFVSVAGFEVGVGAASIFGAGGAGGVKYASLNVGLAFFFIVSSNSCSRRWRSRFASASLTCANGVVSCDSTLMMWKPYCVRIGPTISPGLAENAACSNS